MNYQGKIIETERLLLRVLSESAAVNVLDYYLRNAHFLRPWEPVRDAGFFTLECQRSLLAGELAMMNEGETFRVWLCKKEAGHADRLIGTVALNNIIRGCFQSCFVGYKLDESEVNKGYMTEALGAVIQFAFREIFLHRLEANILPRNSASLRVVQKLGFVQEGLAAKYLLINGKWEDHVHMVLRNSIME